MLQRNIHARITLALDIVRKLTEGPFAGYHQLAVVKHQIGLKDTVSITPSARMSLHCSHPGVPCDESNLCWQAAELVRNTFSVRKSVEITLEKSIPAQGGLAGGSADAAAVLSLCNELWELECTPQKLMELARKIGADVPYYFIGGTALDTETTGVLRPVESSVAMDFVIAFPDFGVSTREAYGQIDYSRIGSRTDTTDSMIRGFEQNDQNLIIGAVHNDFELSVFRSHPELARMKQSLLDAGCLAAFMTGSGSTMVGIAPDSDSAERIASKMPYRTVVTSTR